MPMVDVVTIVTTTLTVPVYRYSSIINIVQITVVQVTVVQITIATGMEMTVATKIVTGIATEIVTEITGIKVIVATIIARITV
ncbi:MAG: hypothetical protein HOM55_06900 [Proteobacteria bacterium]|nr:hypothetical protein [Pseudomonadota bacterium]